VIGLLALSVDIFIHGELVLSECDLGIKSLFSWCCSIGSSVKSSFQQEQIKMIECSYGFLLAFHPS